MNDEKIIAKLLITMQAAYIAQCDQGCGDAMKWIENTLRDRWLIPEITEDLSAQEFFDREIAKLEAKSKEAYGNQD